MYKITVKNELIYFSSVLDTFKILFEEYGIDQNNNELKWMLLCLRLAQDFIPSFTAQIDGKIKRKPVKWTSYKYAKLYKDVMDKQNEKPDLSVKSICIILQKHNKFYASEISLNKRFSESEQSLFINIYKNIKSKLSKEDAAEFLAELLKKEDLFSKVS